MNPSVEEVTADKFLTWGWTDARLKSIPAFVFKTAGKQEQRYNPTGGLLLIEVCLNHRITTWDSHAEFCNYFKQQQDFICQLDHNIRQQLTIRLHSEFKYHNWAEEHRWREFSSDLKIDEGNLHISNLIAKNRLILHSYDSTGILETLSQNIPTIAFWQNGLDHLRDSVKPSYQLLIDAGIVHLSSDSAAQKINEIWNNVDLWWDSHIIQDAREKFCNNFAVVSNTPAIDLKNILEEISSEQK